MRTQTKKDIKEAYKECKKKPYLFLVFPLSLTGFLVIDFIKKDSVLYFILIKLGYKYENPSN